MSKTTVKTTKTHRAGMTLNIAGVEVTFNEELEAEVDDKDLEDVVEQDSSLYMEGDEDADEVTNEGGDETDSDGESEGDSEDSDEDADQSGEETEDEGGEEDNPLADLDVKPAEVTAPMLEDKNKSFSEDVADKMGFPKDEWKDLNKTPLIEYIIEKIHG